MTSNQKDDHVNRCYIFPEHNCAFLRTPLTADINGSAPRQDSGLKDGCVQEQQKSADRVGVGQTLGRLLLNN